MKSVPELQTLRKTMAREIELLNLFAAEEERLKECIFQKDWEKLEKKIKSLGPLSEEIARLDSERDTIFQNVKMHIRAGKEANFYQVIFHFPPHTRNSLTELYRQLKLAVLQVQGITTGIELFVHTVNDSMVKVLDEIYPYRKGKIYCKKGKPKRTELNPHVLNHHL
ncbi:MAG: hypothetical protein AB1798_20340 [Spirochaetota bacterium]